MKIDCSNMQFDPTCSGTMVSKYPFLKDIASGIPDKAVRYLLLMYDSKSPLRNMYPDLQKRKEFAAVVAGYDLVKDESKFEELKTFVHIVTNEEGDEVKVPCEDYLEFLTKLLMYQSSRVWSMIVANESAFYEYHRKVMAEVTDGGDKDILQAVTIKTKLMEAMDDIDKRLKGYYREMSGDDKGLDDLIVKRKKISAESQAVR